MSTTIAIIDYGMGNLRSVAHALAQVTSAKIIVSNAPDVIKNADRVIFPGQGAMPDCLRELQARGLSEVILEVAKTKPFLGICLGLQVLFEESEESEKSANDKNAQGLGIFKGCVKRFSPDVGKAQLGQAQLGKAPLKIPHMGWNNVAQTLPHPLWHKIPNESRFYFVHSFYVDTPEKNIIAGQTDYGTNFTSAISSDNLFALQCHPEKSAKLGLQLLENFVHWKI